MRKRTSKRRWIARCALWPEVPAQAIVEHRLDYLFQFEPVSANRDCYVAIRRRWHG
jgi:hypothetical protein